MNDLIDRQAAIDALADMYHTAERWGEEATDAVIKAIADTCMASIIVMKLRIENLPSVQPERKMGQWVDDGFVGQYRCSECDYNSVDEFNYCPDCGADMRGKQDG